MLFTVTGRPSPVPRLADAFSLVEVIAAVGIFAVGIVAVLGLFAPIAQSVRANGEAEAAADAAALLFSRLRTESFAAVAGYLKTPAQFQQQEGRSDYDPAADGQVFFASLRTEKIGLRSDAAWDGSDRDKFFEITLVRNEDLSPSANDGIAPWLVFNARVRWPAFLPAANGGAVQVGVHSSGAVTFDHGSKQAVVFAGSVRR